MSVLKILPYSHPQLKKKTPRLDLTMENKDDSTDIQVLLKATIEFMYALGLGGVAAPEVGLSLRFFVMDLSSERNQPMCFINPEIIEKTGVIAAEEGVLALPGISINVQRAQEVVVQYQNEAGEEQVFHATGVEAICVQQKVDQLNGIALLDNLSKLKRDRLLKKMKQKEEHSACGHGCAHHHE